MMDGHTNKQMKITVILHFSGKPISSKLYQPLYTSKNIIYKHINRKFTCLLPAFSCITLLIFSNYLVLMGGTYTGMKLIISYISIKSGKTAFLL